MSEKIELETERLQDWLDNAVHDAKSDEAAEVNNAGEEAQLGYLGLTREQAIAQMREALDA